MAPRAAAQGTSRREFLGRAAAATLALGIPPSLGACIPGDRLGRIGLQLYTVRGLMEQDVEATLREVAAIGYQEVEFAGYFNRTPASLRATLDSLGMTAPAAHIPLEQLEPDRWPRMLDAANLLGHRYLVVAWLPPELRRNPDDWKRIAARFDRAGDTAKGRGIQFAYHNHDFEFATAAGPPPFDLLLEAADPDLVRIELDLYWITKAGYDPLAYFTRWPGRFPMVHVKDSAGPPAHEMRDVGGGSIPFATIFAQRKRAGIEHFFVEHDSPSDARASIRASYAHLRRLTF
ncbi:MAG: sugar phosphate isomerase/epimerase family protein [Gemmatimonadaceae bacterium]